jgi:N-acetylglutamate synthase-like GNAT family acetyltransferase
MRAGDVGREPHDVEVWATDLLERELGGRRQARRGEVIDVLEADVMTAERDGRRVGLLAHRRSGDEIELAAIVVEPAWRNAGVGTELVEAFLVAARGSSAPRAWVVTTNDNVRALGFYQRLGFRLTAVRLGAVDEARRRLKPSIPARAHNGIPIRDELELAIDV